MNEIFPFVVFLFHIFYIYFESKWHGTSLQLSLTIYITIKYIKVLIYNPSFKLTISKRIISYLFFTIRVTRVGKIFSDYIKNCSKQTEY